MDLVKIGKYMASKRKNLGMTQRQLAEKLGMSDKSVSKWERGICLPDVSVYSELCLILGISINEFLAGEDIAQENMVQKCEENIIGVAVDSRNNQKRLRAIICVLLAVSILSILIIGAAVYQTAKPGNFIAPVSEDSVEMQTAKLLAAPDGAHIYKFTTTDNYDHINLYITEYQSGKQTNKEKLEFGFGDMGSPKNGEIIIIPDFDHAVINIIISTDGSSQYSTEYSIMKEAEDREDYGRSYCEIEDKIQIEYDSNQPLVGLIYDNDELYSGDFNEMISGETDVLSKNDYVYIFSFEFCK